MGLYRIVFKISTPIADGPPGSGVPESWSVLPDRPNQRINFAVAGDVYHFGIGPAGSFYRSDWHSAYANPITSLWKNEKLPPVKSLFRLSDLPYTAQTVPAIS